MDRKTGDSVTAIRVISRLKDPDGNGILCGSNIPTPGLFYFSAESPASGTLTVTVYQTLGYLFSVEAWQHFFSSIWDKLALFYRKHAQQRIRDDELLEQELSMGTPR